MGRREILRWSRSLSRSFIDKSATASSTCDTPVPRHTSRRRREGGIGTLQARASPFAPLRLVDDETHVNSSRRRRRHHGRRRRVKSVRPKCTAREERGSPVCGPPFPLAARARARPPASTSCLILSARVTDGGKTDE